MQKRIMQKRILKCENSENSRLLSRKEKTLLMHFAWFFLRQTGLSSSMKSALKGRLFSEELSGTRLMMQFMTAGLGLIRALNPKSRNFSTFWSRKVMFSTT